MKKREISSIADEYFNRKVRGSIIILIAGTILLALFLRQMQLHEARNEQIETCSLTLFSTVNALETNSAKAEALETAFHRGNQDVLADISRLLLNELSERIEEPGKEESSKLFSDLMNRSLVSHISLISADGKIVISPAKSTVGTDIVRDGVLKKSEAEKILRGTEKKDGTVDPVKAEVYNGAYYFYSMPFEYRGTAYTLVTGVEATHLDKQIATLGDLHATLSSRSAGNASLVFAADRKSGDLIYCRIGNKDLSGKNIKDAGLSEDVLNDGYNGVETIEGGRYLVLSQKVGDDTVVCAAVKTGGVAAGGGYVLFWSIMSFVLIMIICLVYTVIVRNDFVRKATKTDRVAIRRKGSRELYFDRTVFRRVFPLMIVGTLVIFGISFYTQTLVEVSDSLNRARAVITNISSKYAGELESRKLIRSYYDDLYVSKANLLAFMLEEDPSILNEESGRYHFYYDKNGNRQEVTDAQGRRIRSVPYSESLQEFCNANDLDSVYIIDEGGRTIATNTGNWDYVISHDKKDQSYPFLEVLEGRKQSYVQEAMTDDLGNRSQYIGVPFSYYTIEDGNGNTLYVTEEEYTAAAVRDDPSVTSHRSMIQVGLSEDTSEGLSDAYDLTYTLSVDTIEGGYIELFDQKDDHVCLYSPTRACIGKTAEELEIPDEAFSGEDYCSFEGGYALALFHYKDEYFFETVMLRDFVYQNRRFIAAVTALISFVLLLMMTAFVTINGKEEELLFAGTGWSPPKIPWLSGNPEEKLTKMIYILLMALMAFILVSAYIAENNADENSIIRFIIRGNWDRGFNLFAFSKCVLVLLIVMAAVNLLRIPLKLTAGLFGARGETVGRLLVSVVEYGGMIAAIFYCIYLLGADSSKLLAGVGIMTLIIGLGAQSLIQDIIAGLFMVFEGEFHVGDIVTINGHRGIVQDIGLRTTKIMGIDEQEGNLKIYNNSEITGVLNMSKAPSWVGSTISIEYGQDLEYVEEVLRRELPEVGKGNPMIFTGPVYKGINDLGESGVQLIFHTTCTERNIKPVKRYVNKSILQIFYRNGIRVPFPQMTVSQLDESRRMTMTDLDGGGAEEDKNTEKDNKQTST